MEGIMMTQVGGLLGQQASGGMIIQTAMLLGNVDGESGGDRIGGLGGVLEWR